MENQRRGFAENTSTASGAAGGVAETETLPPLQPYHNGSPRVVFDRATMQNPCFWILMGVLGTVIVGGVIIYVSNQNND